jgi:GT2 family glycosyltransferase
MDFTLSTVCFNSTHLPNTVDSVFQSEFDGTFEYFVVDNASADPSPLDKAIAAHPELKVIRHPINAGFAVANNRALAEARGTYFVLVNPDMILEKDTLQVMHRFLQANPDVAAASCRIVDAEGNLLASRRRFPTPLTMISRFLPWIPGGQERIREYEMADVAPDHVQDVDWLSGGFLFCRTAALKTIGGLDERYFLYFEDVDVCRSLRAHGRIVYNPATQCRHLTKHASRRDLRLFRLHCVASAKFFWKWV